ncbi:DUF3322 and DUF2220 domain-containing protein [Thiocapsa sp.]|uniref:Wadjet anti-phage system protein JetD domain-containing protein n=1 Tax=Thiocapsa sp. TaxID=2024551 RepID=UPI0025F9F06F|nr:DUF3322 and DUF2220 domain-containing protein [Thiocapsa sp.]
MPPSRRIDPAAVAAQLTRRWRNGRGSWLDGGGSWPLQLLLGVPTERETTRDIAGVRAWIAQWQHIQRPGEVIWTERQWPGLGRQRLPERLLLPDPEAVAGWVGAQPAWHLARLRAMRLRALPRAPAGWVDAGERSQPSPVPALVHCTSLVHPRALVHPTAPISDVAGFVSESDLQVKPPRADLSLGRHFDWLANTAEADFERLLGVLHWLGDHPDSHLYIRQLPIPGVDSKWIAANRARVLDLLRQLYRRDGDLHTLAGLRREPDLLRLRILDPALCVGVAGLSDISAPISEIAALPLQPERVFIVENLQTGLAMADLAGSVCFMARGYAVEAFAAIPWLRARPCHYWGDLDTHGFAILNRLRHHLDDVRSLLMDSDTLLRHRPLWHHEENQATGPLDRLTDQEQAVFQGLLLNRWGDRLRLEQERIAWSYAWKQVEHLAGPAQ